MTKRKPKESHKPDGRPTLYKPEYNQTVFKLCLLGANDAEVSDFFGVSESTINLWKLEYPKFSESIQDGKVKADAQVAHKLYDRAMGSEWIEQQAFKIKIQDAPGVFTEDVKVVDVKRVAPPDTQAASLWLRNRQSKKWRDKVDVNVGGQKDNPLLMILESIDGYSADLPENKN